MPRELVIQTPSSLLPALPFTDGTGFGFGVDGAGGATVARPGVSSPMGPALIESLSSTWG